MPSNFATKWSASYLASLTPEQRASFLAELTPQELKSLRYDWSFWARPEQRAPAGALAYMADPRGARRGQDAQRRRMGSGLRLRGDAAAAAATRGSRSSPKRRRMPAT